MYDLRYRSEPERALADHNSDPASPISRGDPLRPHTEAQRVTDAEANSAARVAAPVPISQSPTVAVESDDRRRVIDAEEAANRIRGEFKPVTVAPENARHEPFLTAVAAHLLADPNPANLEEIAKLLADAGVLLPDHEYPKMLYGRTLPDPDHGFDTHVNLRHDHVGVIVNSEEDAGKLGSGWVENPADLPKRKDGEERGKFEPAAKADKPEAEHVETKQGVDPPGWDPQHAVIRSTDGSVDKVATNEERGRRGIALLG